MQHEVRVHDVTCGKRTRMSFSKINEILDMPNLIEVQKNSYRRFLEINLREVLDDISPITDFTDTLSLELVSYRLDKNPKYTVEECKERDVTYSAPLRITVRLSNKETGEVKEQEVFMGDFPLMTEYGTFIINGAERVIVSQLVRSPGTIFNDTIDKNGLPLYGSTVIPNRGAWLEFESDARGVLWVRVDRTRKQPASVILRALGLGTDAEIIDLFGEQEKLMNTLEKDSAKTAEAGLLEIYKRLRPGEPPTVESAQNLLGTLFFDPRRYDLARVGRYKFNKKLSLDHRIIGYTLHDAVKDPGTGEIIAPAGTQIDRELAKEINNSGVQSVALALESSVVKVVGNRFVDADVHLAQFGLEAKELGIKERMHWPSFKALVDASEGDIDLLQEKIKESLHTLVPKHIYVDDVFAAFSYLIGLYSGIGHTDDIDHLGNRRLRSVGELLQNQIRVGLARMERVVKERMAIQDLDNLTPQALINIRPVSAAIKEFFGSSQLSHFMDQTNPLAELTNKRRLSALGPGGLNRDRASFDVRDVHHSHYGRICPIETPEGPNIGLIGSLSIFARINEYGFIEAPYRRVMHGEAIVTDIIDYLTADEEDLYVTAQANEVMDENNMIINQHIPARARGEIMEVSREEVDYMDISPRQVVSIATAMIPFLENDDANRALMGCNMQRQAVPLLIPEAPYIATGMEGKAAYDSGVLLITKHAGIVKKVSANAIIIDGDDGERHEYKLAKFARSNQGTCINQHPLVVAGQKVEAGEILADGPSTENGEISLGRNILLGFMTWEGYNYEDAILISEKLVKEDVFTSIHIEEHDCEARDTKLGPEEITREIPNVSDESLSNLDERGIIRVGAEVKSGDILVGKVTPKGETELNPEERLLRAIFGEKVREVRDTSLKVPHGEEGIVVDVKTFTRKNHDELPPGVNEVVRVYIAQRKKISVGDKMAGRHGNKGVISRILPEEDMPFLPDGTPLEICLNPLGVPSRMNIGQVLEVHLGMIAKANDWHIATPVFDGAHEEDILALLEQQGNSLDGKSTLYDGRTGEAFENPVTVGYMYILKLHHLVDDKIHARSTGPYSLVTQQPLGGKAQFGGQRFGEMEVWALEAYGAAHILQEILTVKSDDVVGRVKTYEAIVKGENIPEPGIPESFKVLIKELQSLALNVEILGEDKRALDLRSIEDVEEQLKKPAEDEIDFDQLTSTTAPADDGNIFDSIELDDLESLPGLDELTDDVFGKGLTDVVEEVKSTDVTKDTEDDN